MTIKELLGDKYKDDMTIKDVEKALEGVNLGNLSSGEYVSKSKYDADTKTLAELQTQVNGKQGEIDKAVAKATSELRSTLEKEYKKQLADYDTATKRKTAENKAYGGYSDEQKALLKAFIKDEELKFDAEKEEFSNFEELAKTVKEKFAVNFPTDDGTKSQAGVPPVKTETGGDKDDLFGFGKAFGGNKK